MMNDLFSSFDFATNQFLSFFPTGMILLLLLFTPAFSASYFKSSKKFFLVSQLEHVWFDQLKGTKSIYLKSAFSFILVLFFSILFLNIMSMNPYFFSTTVHTIFSLSAAWLTWLAVILSSMMFKITKFLGQFLPFGTPLWLAPFISIIEFFSTSVRPITLGFRLTANMMMGHIILSLMSLCLMVTGSGWMFSIIFFLFAFYFLFELMICFIQASVFSLLTSMYVAEHA